MKSFVRNNIQKIVANYLTLGIRFPLTKSKKGVFLKKKKDRKPFQFSICRE